MDNQTAINRINDIDEIVRLLRERIASHDLSPGSKLRENELAKEFGESRTTIREVFTALELRGLIVRIPNRGAVVARLNPDEVFALYDVREVLEALAYRLATQNAPVGAWDDLVERFRNPPAGIDRWRRYGKLPHDYRGTERSYAAICRQSVPQRHARSQSREDPCGGPSCDDPS